MTRATSVSFGTRSKEVFGCCLEALCYREGGTVPRFVQQCVEAVEQRGLDADGIYRVNGNLAVIQKLRFIVDRERAVTSDGRYVFPEQRSQEDKLRLSDPQWDDVHVITGALKLFFRELPEPVVPFSLFNEFIAAVTTSIQRHIVSEHNLMLSDYANSRKSIQAGGAGPDSPHSNRTPSIICWSISQSDGALDANRMTTQNIGIVLDQR
uniref:Uncharacterized protein n=1 Tax=Sphaerodactylus townsendi TaxID=933632 RepID=A0ACB8EP70_9SAUR